jgi:hypothetical protein
VLKGEKAKRAVKRTASKSGRHASPARKKTSSRNHKPARRVTMFKSTNWYDRVAQSIGISPRAST